MSYCLLTGATGFLGRYLLRGLLASGDRVVVLVRPGKIDTPRQRIEVVMRHFERLEGGSLARPVVFSGELSSPSLGLDKKEQNWLRENVRVVIHCAAAMMFRPDNRGEPYRTNVEGIRRLLAMCEWAGIDRFHHVSTAYLCGLREGRVLETELDLGQKLGNVYEKSKLEAEKLIRNAEFINEKTFYRPASIVGDSRTGFTTSYHGFYLPLQLAYTIANRVTPEQMGKRFFSRLGLSGHEGKNLVPVDWVAAAILHLVLHPEHHGKTYHLASPHPVSVSLVQQVVQEAIQKYSNRPQVKAASEEEMEVYERLFQEHMTIYQSHWRDDPGFDLTNTYRALKQLPCPEMDGEILMRVARFAVENGFSSRQHESLTTSFDVEGVLAGLMQNSPGSSNDLKVAKSVSLQINGQGGGQWHLRVVGDRLLGVGLGLGPAKSPGYYLNADTFTALSRGELTVERSLGGGRTILEAPREEHCNLIRVLRQVVSAS